MLTCWSNGNRFLEDSHGAKKLLAAAEVCFVLPRSSARQRGCCTASDVSALEEGKSEMRLNGLREVMQGSAGCGRV